MQDTLKPGYTRISSILGQWDTFGHIDPQVLANKAGIGTRVHEAIDNFHNGIFTPLEYSTAGYFDSYVKWDKAVNPKFIKNEERYYCDKLMITGQVDAICLFPGDEKPCIVDYKTSVAESPKMWPLQACFYHYLAQQSGVELSNRLIFIKLDKLGEMPKIFEYTYTKQLWNVCLAAWTTYRHLHS
jgi:hypothetical protein